LDRGNEPSIPWVRQQGKSEKIHASICCKNPKILNKGGQHMWLLNLILAVIALIIAILAYQKVGGMADLRKQIDQIASSVDLRKSIDSMAAATDSLREKTAEAIGRLEATFKREAKEEKKPPKRAAPKRRRPRQKKTEKTEEPS